MKTYCGSADINPRILNLGTRSRLVVSFMPRGQSTGRIGLRIPPCLHVLLKIWSIIIPKFLIHGMT